MAEQNFWSMMDDLGKQESGSGGGILSHVTIEVGYKVFASGMHNKESWFPFKPGDDNAKETAKAAAQKLAAETGANMSYSVNLICPVTESYSAGKQATWADDRHFVTPWFTKATSDVVMPSVKKVVNSIPATIYARLGFKDDPYYVEKGEMEEYEGKMRYKQVAYIVETFSDEAEMLSNLSEQDGSSDSTPQGWQPVSQSWSADALQASIADIKAAVAGSNVTQTATDFALDPSDVLVALGAHREEGAPPAIAKKYGVDVSTVAALRSKADEIPF